MLICFELYPRWCPCLWSTLARVRNSGKFISVKHLQLFLLWIYWAAVRIIWVYVIAGSPRGESELAVCRAEKGKDRMNPPGKNYSERTSIFHMYFSSFILFKWSLRGLCKIGQHLGPVYMEWGTPVWWGWFLLFSRSKGHKTKETYPTRPGSPTPCKQCLR